MITLESKEEVVDMFKILQRYPDHKMARARFRKKMKTKARRNARARFNKETSIEYRNDTYSINPRIFCDCVGSHTILCCPQSNCRSSGSLKG